MSSNLPPPQTFAEGERLIYGRLMAGMGIFAGLAAIGLCAAFIWGHWPVDDYGQILTILGYALDGFLLAMVAVMIALAVGGPVGRFKGSATPTGVDIEADSSDDQEGPGNGHA